MELEGSGEHELLQTLTYTLHVNIHTHTHTRCKVPPAHPETPLILFHTRRLKAIKHLQAERRLPAGDPPHCLVTTHSAQSD